MFKYIFLSFLFVLNCSALEYTSKIKCVNGVCNKEQYFKNLGDQDLKFADLAVEQCLINIKTNKVYRILSLDSSTTRVTTVTEDSNYTLTREYQYFNSPKFNIQMKIIPCEQTPGLLGDNVNFQKCLQQNGTGVKKLFCERERKHDY